VKYFFFRRERVVVVVSRDRRRRRRRELTITNLVFLRRLSFGEEIRAQFRPSLTIHGPIRRSKSMNRPIEAGESSLRE